MTDQEKPFFEQVHDVEAIVKEANTPEELVVHYTILPKHDPENLDEIRRYDCSECDEDIFNLGIHAQFTHGTIHFDVDTRNEIERPQAGTPEHPCGILGCTFPATHIDAETPHSWENLTGLEGGIDGEGRKVS